MARLPSAGDRRAALFIIAVNRHAFPDAVDAIRIAAGEGVDRGAIRRVDDKNTADRRFAVVGKQRAGGAAGSTSASVRGCEFVPR